jgi:predicted RNA-binding protein Jag
MGERERDNENVDAAAPQWLKRLGAYMKLRATCSLYNEAKQQSVSFVSDHRKILVVENSKHFLKAITNRFFQSIASLKKQI